LATNLVRRKPGRCACRGERQQVDLLQHFTAEGLECKAVLA
jgi:hypothetical protein